MKKIFLKEAGYLLLLSGGCIGILEALDPFGNSSTLYKEEEEIIIGENDTLNQGSINDSWLKRGKDIPYHRIHKFKELPSSVKDNPLYKDIEKASDIERNVTKVYCSNRMFSNHINWNSKKEGKSSLNQEFSSKKGNIQSGCLSVLWHRNHYKNNKWRGSWKLIWILRDGNYATMFISTLIADKGKIQVDGNAYILKENGSKKWRVLAWHGNKDRQTVSERNKNKLIPLPGPMVNKAAQRWGFSFNSRNVCKETDKDCKKSKGYTYANQNWTFVKGKSSPVTKKMHSVSEWNQNSRYWSAEKSLFPHNLTKSYENIKGYYELIETDMIKWLN